MIEQLSTVSRKESRTCIALSWRELTRENQRKDKLVGNNLDVTRTLHMPDRTPAMELRLLATWLPRSERNKKSTENDDRGHVGYGDLRL